MNNSTEVEATTIGSYVIAIARALDSLGIDSESIFQDAGVDTEIGTTPLDQVPYPLITKLFKLSVEASGDVYFGLYVARFLRLHHLHSLGYSLLASETLLDFLQRLTQHYRLLGNTSSLSLEESDSEITAHIRLLTKPCFETQDAFTAFLVRFMRDLHRPDFAPLRVELARPQPPEGPEPYEQLFKSPVSFGNAAVALHFRREDLILPLLGSSKELAQHNDNITVAYLSHMESTCIVSKVKALLHEGIHAHQASIEKISEKLSMSPRSLQTKLAQNDTSFQKLLDQTRLDLACQYLEQRILPVAKIATTIGFHETSSFYRAFKRWTGQSIQQYRTSRQSIHSK